MEKTILKITVNACRIIINSSERLEEKEFKTIKSLGFRYSYGFNGFVFDDRESGWERVARIINATDETKDHRYYDLTACVVELSEVAKEKLSSFESERAEKKAKEKAEKEAKEAHAQKGRNKKFQNCLKVIKQAKNGFTNDMYHLSMNNFSILDSGLTKAVDVHQYCIDHGLKDPMKEDFIYIHIGYRKRWHNWTQDENYTLEASISGYTNSHTDGFVAGGSGHFHMTMKAGEVERRKTEQLIKVTEVFDEDLTLDIMRIYCNHYNGIEDGSETYDAGSKIGMADYFETFNEKATSKLQAMLSF